MLVKGKRLALVPLYLGFLFTQRLVSKNVFRFVGIYDVVIYADGSFFRLFLWERFGALSHIPVEFKPEKPQKVIVDGVEKEKTSHLKWSRVTWSEEARKPLSNVINVEKSCNFRQYTYTPQE